MGSLDLMFQNGMKNFGAMGLGQQQVADQQMADAKLREQQLSNDNAATMNPLNAQFRQGQIDTQNAALPGVQANSKMLGLQADEESQLAATKVAEKLSTYTNQIGVNGVQKMGRDGAIASQAAAALQNYPPALHKQVLPKLIAAYGGDPSSPTFQGLMNINDADVAKATSALGQGMTMASADYMQKVGITNLENASREKIAGGHDNATIRAAEIAAQSRVQAAQTRASMMKHMTTDQKIAALSDAVADGSATPEEIAQYNSLRADKERLRALGVNPLGAQTIGTPAAADAIKTPQVGNGFGAQPAGPNNFGAATGGDKKVVRTGTANGRKVIQYSDGSIEYAN